jgi:hypothetical protein
VRTLSSALTTAQQAASREPYVAVTVENLIGSLRRLDFTQLDNSGSSLGRHGVAVAGDGSVTRVAGNGAGRIDIQHIANPGAGSSWGSWGVLASGKGNQLAVAACGAHVVVVYNDAAGTGIYYVESTDYGASYGAETAVATAAAAVLGLAVALKNTGGDLAVAWLTAATLNIIKRTAGAFGAASGAGISTASLNGVAMCYGADWDIAVTGEEVTTNKRTLWTIAYGDGFDLAPNTWGVLNAQQQAESDSGVALIAPAIVYTDGYHLDYVEQATYGGGKTRTYRTTLHQLQSYVAGANIMSTPVPTAYFGVNGLALAADVSGTGWYYETAANLVTRAPQAQSLTTLTADVLAVAIDERGDATRGYVELDNAGGAYAGPPAPIALGNRVNLSWGYRTASGLQSSQMAGLSIASYEYRRAGGVSTLRLQVEGGWELLRRNRQRAQVVQTSGVSWFQLLSRVMSRAGLNLTSSGASARATGTTPQFTIDPQTSGFDAVQQALAFLADRIRMNVLGGVLTERLAGAASTYTYGGAHPLREARLVGAPPPVSDVQVHGLLAIGEDIDYASAAVGLGTRELARDLNAVNGANAITSATARRRQRALDAPAGALVVPPNCGQEVLDLVDFTDAAISASAVKRRVAGIDWRYERRRGVYEQTLHLGAA